MASTGTPQHQALATATQSTAVRALDVLFAPGERWGWEWRDPDKLFRPFPKPPPSEPVIAPAGEANQAANEYSAWKGKLILLIPGVFFGALLVFLPLDLIVGPGTAQGIWNILAVCVAEGWLVVRTRGLRRRAQEFVPNTDAFRQRHEALTREYAAALAEWAREGASYGAREKGRVDALPIWGAVAPAVASRRVDIFGGTVEGWQAITTTLGCSLLGSGERLYVLDLSESDVASLLFAVADLRGVQTRVHVLPNDAAAFDILAGLDASAAKDLLVEAFRGEADSRERAVDDNILGCISEILAPALSMQRFHSALQVLLREAVAPGGDGMPLSEDEWTAISQLFGDEYREVIRPNLVYLASQLRPFRTLGSDAKPTSSNGEVVCEGVAIGRQGGAFVNEELVNMLVQRTIRQLRADREGGRGRALFIIGADLLPTRHFEKLDDLAAALGMRIVYLFRRVKGDAREVLGGGGAGVGVMRSGTPQEAEQAAALVGREYRFVLSQVTLTTGTTWSRNWGESETRGGMMPSYGVNFGTTASDSEGRTNAEARVHEYIVEPETIKSLHPTAILFPEPVGGGRQHIRVADCNPTIASDQRASPLPFTT